MALRLWISPECQLTALQLQNTDILNNLSSPVYDIYGKQRLALWKSLKTSGLNGGDGSRQLGI